MGLAYRAKKCHRESPMSRGSESEKNSEILLKAAGSSLRTPGERCGRQGARGWLARPLVIFGGQPVFKYEPVIRVRGERKRNGEIEVGTPLIPRHKVCITRYKAVEKGRK